MNSQIALYCFEVMKADEADKDILCTACPMFKDHKCFEKVSDYIVKAIEEYGKDERE